MPVLKVKINGEWVNVGGGNGDINIDGYATEEWVTQGYQPKGNYVTSQELSQITDELKAYVDEAILGGAW